MNPYETVKAHVSVKDAAERYGLRVTGHGMTCCPFHDDRTPSMKINEDYYYCFGCQATGDVIDLTARLFTLRAAEAVRKLAADFGIAPDRPPTATVRKTDAQKCSEQERLCVRVLSGYRDCLTKWKKTYAPQTPDDPIRVRFVEACRKLDETEYDLDILCLGDAYERRKMVSEWLTGNKIHELKRRMDHLDKEETCERNKYRHNDRAI